MHTHFLKRNVNLWGISLRILGSFLRLATRFVECLQHLHTLSLWVLHYRETSRGLWIAELWSSEVSQQGLEVYRRMAWHNAPVWSLFQPPRSHCFIDVHWSTPTSSLNCDTEDRTGYRSIGRFGPGVERCVHYMLGQSVFSTFKPMYCSEYTIFHRGWLMSAQVTTRLLIFHWKQDLKTEEIIFYINTHITPRNQAPCVCLSSVLLCVL